MRSIILVRGGVYLFVILSDNGVSLGFLLVFPLKEIPMVYIAYGFVDPSILGLEVGGRVGGCFGFQGLDIFCLERIDCGGGSFIGLSFFLSGQMLRELSNLV